MVPVPSVPSGCAAPIQVHSITSHKMHPGIWRWAMRPQHPLCGAQRSDTALNSIMPAEKCSNNSLPHPVPGRRRRTPGASAGLLRARRTPTGCLGTACCPPRRTSPTSRQCSPGPASGRPHLRRLVGLGHAEKCLVVSIQCICADEHAALYSRPGRRTGSHCRIWL